MTELGDVARERERLGSTFREGGERYAELRPGFPADAVAAALGDRPLDIVDVGAGTGKLTRVLLDLGHRVQAVEPSESMLVQVRSTCPEASARLATGETTGLPDDCCDAVTYGQAWHWVEPERASREAARILRPGGRLVLLWNFMDLSVSWVAGLNQTMHSLEGGYEPRSESAQAVSRAHFGPAEHDEARWSVTTTTRALTDLVTTRSYYLAASPSDRALLAGRVHDYVDGMLGGVDDRAVTLPYVTDVYVLNCVS